MGQKLYTVAELAEMFGKSRQTIHNWLDDGVFPNKFEVGEGGGKIVLIPASDVAPVKEREAAKLKEQLARLGFRGLPA